MLIAIGVSTIGAVILGATDHVELFGLGLIIMSTGWRLETLLRELFEEDDE